MLSKDTLNFKHMKKIKQLCLTKRRVCQLITQWRNQQHLCLWYKSAKIYIPFHASFWGLMYLGCKFTEVYIPSKWVYWALCTLDVSLLSSMYLGCAFTELYVPWMWVYWALCTLDVSLQSCMYLGCEFTELYVSWMWVYWALCTLDVSLLSSMYLGCEFTEPYVHWTWVYWARCEFTELYVPWKLVYYGLCTLESEFTELYIPLTWLCQRLTGLCQCLCTFDESLLALHTLDASLLSRGKRSLYSWIWLFMSLQASQSFSLEGRARHSSQYDSTCTHTPKR